MTHAARALPTNAPRLRLLISAMNDQDERREVPTLVPETDRESPTNPHASEAPLEPSTMLPPTTALAPEPETQGHGAGEDTKLLSTNQLIALYSEFRSTQTDILSESGGFAKLLTRRDERLVASFAALVESNVKAVVSKLEPRFGAQDSKLATITSELATLTSRIAEITSELSALTGRISAIEKGAPARNAAD